MKFAILSAFLAAVTVDQPPPGFDAGVSKAQVSDAGFDIPPEPAKKSVQEVRRREFENRMKALAEMVSREDGKSWSVGNLMFASQNSSAKLDAAVVVFTTGKEVNALFYLYEKGQWKLFPEIFR
jgi:hypothetical protein